MQYRFADRSDAGRRLADALAPYAARRPLILAIPRGGIPVGRIVADRLGGDLDVVLVRKIGAPGNPEFAIGSVDEAGRVQLADYAHRVRADPGYVRRASEQELAVMQARRALYSPHRPRLDPAGRTVIVVDDGLATGETMRAALASVRGQHPARLVAAVPVGARESLDALAELADEIVCLDAPKNFYAVGPFYASFPSVDDDEAVALLAGAASAARGSGA